MNSSWTGILIAGIFVTKANLKQTDNDMAKNIGIHISQLNTN